MHSGSSSASSYATSYSGIGGSPNRPSDSFRDSQIVRSGTVNVKEDGFASWLWRPKWLILKEQMLTIHKNEVSLLEIDDDAEILRIHFKMDWRVILAVVRHTRTS